MTRPLGESAGEPRPRNGSAPDEQAPPDRAAGAPGRPAPQPPLRPVRARDAWTGNLRASVDKLVADLKSDGRAVKRQGRALGDAVSAHALPLLRAAGATPRAARLAREAGRLFAAYRWHHALASAMTPEAARAERDALDRRSAERLHRLCIELGGAMIKLGQFASTRRDLLPTAYIEALGRLQDAVPPIPFERIAERVSAELGAPIEQLFAAFDPEPLAAGSLAQVHGAVLPDGTRVAVKVQVPDVENLVEADLSLFSLIAGALREPLLGLDLVPIAVELGRSVRSELDFGREAEHARRMSEDLADDPSVLVPRVHRSLSTSRVLTLDRVDGERLTAFLDRCRGAGGARADGDRVLAALVRTYASQILGAGRFQADPHPGNFLVCRDGRLALLDFGATRELSPDQRRAYTALTRAIIVRDRGRALALMTELGFTVREGGDPAALIELGELLLDSFRPAPDRSLAEIDPRAAFDRALALGRKSSVSIPHHFVQIGRVLSAIAGLVLAYRPDIELWQLVAPHLVSPDS